MKSIIIRKILRNCYKKLGEEEKCITFVCYLCRCERSDSPRQQNNYNNHMMKSNSILRKLPIWGGVSLNCNLRISGTGQCARADNKDHQRYCHGLIG